MERYDRDPWVRRLVDNRVVLVMPMTNAIGVNDRRREELGIDPNRDFPYDQQPSQVPARRNRPCAVRAPRAALDRLTRRSSYRSSRLFGSHRAVHADDRGAISE